MSSLHVETTLGLCASRGSRTIDVGAGLLDGLLVVADGLSGHSTGWIGARLAIRTICERFAEGRAEPRFIGAADEVPDDWGWAGAMQSRSAGVYVYGEIAALLGDRAALPRDLDGLFFAVDHALCNVPQELRISGQLVECIAATFEGARVRGAHAGVGRALLLRAEASQVESLVVEHYLHLVFQRSPKYREIDPAQIPPRIVCNGIGGLESGEVGIDHFDIELGAGDLLLLCSERLDIGEEELGPMMRAALDEGASLEDLARQIERRSAQMFEPSEAHQARDVAFGLVLARASAT